MKTLNILDDFYCFTRKEVIKDPIPGEPIDEEPKVENPIVENPIVENPLDTKEKPLN